MLLPKLQATLDRWQLFAPCLGTQVSLAFYKDSGDVTHWHGSSGYKQSEPLLSFEPNTPAYIYSITKVFTALCILKSVQQQKLALDTPLSDYLPALQVPSNITIRHLLSHRSGIKSYTDLKAYVPAVEASPRTPWTDAEVLTKIELNQVAFEAGTQFHYNNSGYFLLRLLLEKVWQKPYQKIVDALLVVPLKLSQTRVVNEPGHTVPGYDRYFNPARHLENIQHKYHPGWCLTGLITSTPADVLRVYHALFFDHYLPSHLQQEMLKHASIDAFAGPHFKSPGYGLGLMTDPDHQHGPLYGHGGSGPGFNTWSGYYPEKRVMLCIICNTNMEQHPFFLVQDLLSQLSPS